MYNSLGPEREGKSELDYSILMAETALESAPCLGTTLCILYEEVIGQKSNIWHIIWAKENPEAITKLFSAQTPRKNA